MDAEQMFVLVVTMRDSLNIDVEYVHTFSHNINRIVHEYALANVTLGNVPAITRIRALRYNAGTWEQGYKEIERGDIICFSSSEAASYTLKTSDDRSPEFQVIRHPHTHERMDTDQLLSSREDLEELTVIEQLRDSREKTEKQKTHSHVEKQS